MHAQSRDCPGEAEEAAVAALVGEVLSMTSAVKFYLISASESPTCWAMRASSDNSAGDRHFFQVALSRGVGAKENISDIRVKQVLPDANLRLKYTSPVVARARVLVHEVLGRGAQADARGAAQVLDRRAQAVARGAAD